MPAIAYGVMLLVSKCNNSGQVGNVADPSLVRVCDAKYRRSGDTELPRHSSVAVMRFVRARALERSEHARAERTVG